MTTTHGNNQQLVDFLLIYKNTTAYLKNETKLKPSYSTKYVNFTVIKLNNCIKKN